VDEVQVVTGRGQLVTASASTNSELFYAVLAGAGQCGIIVRVKVKLIPAKTTALIMELFYDDLPTFLADSEKVMRDTRFQHQEGEFKRNADNTAWRYKISLGVYYSGAAPDPNLLLSGMRDVQADRHSLTLPFEQWAFRLDPFEAFLKENNLWNEPKPWLSLMIPSSKIEAFVRDVLPGITLDDIGAGIAGSYPMPTSKLTRPLFVRPNAEVIYFFDLLRFPFPGANAAAMIDQNRRLFDKAVALGGKRYIIGAIPMTVEDWKRHYGPLWSVFLAAKRYFDPDNVLTPGWNFFA
jgi:cytokinin dehydrogenase